MKENKELALFGGKKIIRLKKPHYLWPPISKKKIKAVNNYLKNENTFINNGYPDIVKKFEYKFAKYMNIKYALALNSGTSALHAAFFAVGISNQDEILAPNLTFFATATPIKTFDAMPVLCDCQNDTGNICPKDIKKKITNKTKALVITHLCGHPCDLDSIIQICKNNKIFLIEDCSHAYDSTYNNKKVGTFGDIGIFSMDSNKLLSAGEGGVLITNNKKFFEKSLMISDFGPRLHNSLTITETKKYKDTGYGFKHRIHPLAATIAFNEIDNLKKYIKLRTKKLNYISKALKNIPSLYPPITKKNVSRGAFYSYRIFYNKKELNYLPIDDLIKALRAEGMDVRYSGNLPLHKLEYFKIDKKIISNFTNSENFYKTTISIPTFTFEKYYIIDKYIEIFKKVCDYYSKKKNY